MRKKRKNYSAQEKVAILRMNLLEKVAVSDICYQYKLQPTVFYRWQKQFFEQGERAFEDGKFKRKAQGEKDKITALEEKIQRKNEVLSELMEEHVKLKKNLGEI